MSNFDSKYQDAYGNALQVGDRVLFAKRVGNRAELEERYIERITEKGLFLNAAPDYDGRVRKNSSPVGNFENLVKFPETKVNQLWAALYEHVDTEADEYTTYLSTGAPCTSLSCAKDSVQVLNSAKLVGFVALENAPGIPPVTANTYALDRWDDKKGDS